VAEDQSVSIATGASGTSAHEYLWISSTEPGKVSPASELKIIHHMAIKGGLTRHLDCEGFIDRSDPEKIEIRLAVNKRGHWASVRQSHFNGHHRIAPQPAAP
ncbi:MAG: hypothetical protein AAGB14_08690, partial [Verrucomicrobiota bacterium]